MLEKLNISWDDIETNDTSLGFNDLSLEQFRQDLLDEMRKKMIFTKICLREYLVVFLKVVHLKI